VLVVASALALLALPAPAGARNIGSDDEIVITGTVRVPRGEHADRVVIGDGRVEIQGHVDGVILAFDAPVHIARGAVVDGDVISISRKVTVDTGATLNNDLIYFDDKPSVARKATVYGDVRHANGGDFFFSSLLVHAAIWIAFTLSSLVLGLILLWLVPASAVGAVFQTARGQGGAAIAWGIVLFVGIPLAAIVAVLTLVGIPLGLLMLLALLPLYAVGYVTSAYVLGRALLSAGHGAVAAFFAGWGILRAVALVPGAGALAWLAATVFGLGVLTVALWRSRRLV
jgi:cytoskeletal protein CcmA (bactofilin family)